MHIHILGTSFYLSNSIYVTTRTAQRNKCYRKYDRLKKKIYPESQKSNEERSKKKTHTVEISERKETKSDAYSNTNCDLIAQVIKFPLNECFIRVHNLLLQFYLTSRLLNYIIIIMTNVRATTAEEARRRSNEKKNSTLKSNTHTAQR